MILTIDGIYGEGGGQILRTSLALAAILTQSVHIKNIRAGRNNPGLAAQHLTAVRAAAAICGATVRGDLLGSTELTFEPQRATTPATYEFDVAEAREGGSAGAATLILQTVLLPLALAKGNSTVLVKGGTHVPWSPSFHYLEDVFLPTLEKLGLSASAALSAWGWYPAGQGQIEVEVIGNGSVKMVDHNFQFERGPLQKITGIAVASSLPAHIAQRMSQSATKRLEQAGLPVSITPQRVRSVSPGAGIFLTAEYESSRAGFGAIGRKGKPAEVVANEAVDALLSFHQTEATLDEYLADQILLPLILAGYHGSVSVQSLTRHTLTNIWVIEQFLGSTVKPYPDQNKLEFLPRL